MSLPGESTEESDPFSSFSCRDVDKVKVILLTKLPYELIDIILEEAQYWAYISTENDSFFRIRTSSSPTFNAKYIISVSEPIPKHTRVKLVQFRIRSQEYRTGLLSLGNSYDSYTWFEASILRPKHTHQPLPESPINLSSPLDACVLEELGWTEIFNPNDLRNRRWRVQANATIPHPKVHHITWYPTNKVGNAAFEAEYDVNTGKGSGLGFVELLRAGDRIALVGRALFAGHENRVLNTQIEFAYHI